MRWKPNSSQLLTVIMLLVFGCAAYSLPWLTNPGSGLSLGAYDLAEWTSLHPTVRSSNPVLLTTLLLRLPLACLGLIISIGLLQGKLGFALLLIVLTGIALLPPLDFFTQYRDDPNYQQQFFLALFTIAAGFLSKDIRSEQLKKSLVVLVAIAGAGSSLAGLLQSYALLEQFMLPTQFGLGGIGLVAIYAISATYFLWANKWSIKQTR